MTKTPILRATKKDWIATGVIAGVCAIALGGAYFTADIRDSSLTQEALPTGDQVTVLASAPQAVKEVARFDTDKLTGLNKPVVARGLLLTAHDGAVTAHNPDGSTAWTYARKGGDICSLASAWDRAIITYRTGVGCGDVVSIDAKTGQYADTRSAVNSDDVVPVTSNDSVGTVSPKRVELWRSDLVRTVEYGFVEAPQEANFQPNPDCVLHSALARKELLAVAETCPTQQNATALRLMKVAPSDSRKPDISANISIPAPGAQVVAVSQEAAAVYIPGDTPELRTYDKNSLQISSQHVAPSPAVMESPAPFAPATADLPHHMTWFDGERLYLLNPANLSVQQVIEDALGTGVSIGQELVVPTKEGLAVVNWNDGQIVRTIPVDRGGYAGPVSVVMSGTALAEMRGETTVMLGA